MSYWSFPVISAGAILCVTLIYITVRWRKAPTAFKAMNCIGLASLAAGVLLGVWGVHVFNAWTRSEAARSASISRGESSTPPRSSEPASAIPSGTPAVSSSVRAVPAEHASALIGAYVGQALAQRRAEGFPLANPEAWPEVDQGCRLGNYETTSKLCRAATLAVHGWGDTRAVSYAELAGFCAAGYLEKRPNPTLPRNSQVAISAPSAAPMVIWNLGPMWPRPALAKFMRRRHRPARRRRCESTGAMRREM